MGFLWVIVNSFVISSFVCISDIGDLPPFYFLMADFDCHFHIT